MISDVIVPNVLFISLILLAIPTALFILLIIVELCKDLLIKLIGKYYKKEENKAPYKIEKDGD